MRFLITGHTGFKGSWLTMLLSSLGHSVSGVALNPTEDSLFDLCGAGELLEHDVRGDIRELSVVKSAMKLSQPDVVVHLAAQPLVRESYDNPQLTVETNVVGTMNILTACAEVVNLQALLVITTDKVYRNTGKRMGYSETDPLGGIDPYSASKAMADILCQSWSAGIAEFPILILRAGNVIGGGDRAKDRIVPDLVRGFAADKPVVIRHPSSIRPWQHVLDCLNGYLLALDSLLRGSSELVWNIGPSDASPITVGQLADLGREFWGSGKWAEQGAGLADVAESSYLTLDSRKARNKLGWRDHLPFPESLVWTMSWERDVHNGADPLEKTAEQVKSFMMMEPRLHSLGK